MDSFTKIINNLVANHEEFFPFLMELADNYAMRGAFEKAFYIREELLKKELSSEEKLTVLKRLAEDFHKAGMYDSAIQTLKHAIAISEDKDELLDILSHFYLKLKEWKNVLSSQNEKKNINKNFVVYALCQWSKELLERNDYNGALKKLQEAENFDKGNVCVHYYLADLFLYQKNKEELIKLATKTSLNSPCFFGILLKKILSQLSLDRVLAKIVISHLKNHRKDFYTAYIFSRKLMDEGDYLQALKFLRSFYNPHNYNPQLLFNYIECAVKTDNLVEKEYLSQLINKGMFYDKWFRCSSCGYESDEYTFLCARCGKFNVLKQISCYE